MSFDSGRSAEYIDIGPRARAMARAADYILEVETLMDEDRRRKAREDGAATRRVQGFLIWFSIMVILANAPDWSTFPNTMYWLLSTIYHSPLSLLLAGLIGFGLRRQLNEKMGAL